MKALIYVPLLSMIHFATMASPAVSYNFAGRLGDSLVQYAQALWVSYKREIPLLYRPFKYSEQFELSRIHDSYNNVKDGQFTKVVHLGKGLNYNIYDLKTDENILYMIPFFCGFKRELVELGYPFYFDVDWKDVGFLTELRKGIALINRTPKLIDLPKDRIPVAVHIRTGDGFDKIFQLRERGFDDKITPRKFPPNAFFIDQLKRMSEMLGDQPLYVHIFTDSSRPEHFAKLLEKEVNKPNITYGYRTGVDLLDDLFSIMQFKHLIRGESHFSFIAGILAECEICIVPAEYVWEEKNLIITKVEDIIR